MPNHSGNILFDNPRFNVGDIVEELCIEDQTSVMVAVLKVKLNIRSEYLYDVYCIDTGIEYSDMLLKDTPESNYPFMYRKVPNVFQR